MVGVGVGKGGGKVSVGVGVGESGGRVLVGVRVGKGVAVTTPTDLDVALGTSEGVTVVVLTEVQEINNSNNASTTIFNLCVDICRV